MPKNHSKLNALGDGPLHQAVLKKSTKQAKEAIIYYSEHLEDVNDASMNCLHLLASIHNDYKFVDKFMRIYFDGLSSNHQKLSKILSMQDCVGNTPIHIALYKKNLNFLKTLLKMGIDPISLIDPFEFYSIILRSRALEVSQFFAGSLKQNSHLFNDLREIAETYNSTECLANLYYDSLSLERMATQALSDQQMDVLNTLPSQPLSVQFILNERHQALARQIAREAIWDDKVNTESASSEYRKGHKK